VANLHNKVEHFDILRMIRDFWVQNYFSIKEKQSLNFVAKSNDDVLAIEIVPGVFLNKLGVLYGSNASGKSNMLLAIQNVFSILFTPRFDITDEVTSGPAFELTKDKPIKMHVSFYAESILYEYDVEYYSEYILKEQLYYYPNNSKALFYERNFQGNGKQANIKLGNSLNVSAQTKKALTENTLNNHSVLSTYRKVAFKDDIQKIAILYKWIEEHVHEVNGDKEQDIILELKSITGNKTKYEFYIEMLKKADLNISGFKYVTEKKALSKAFQEYIQSRADFDDATKQRILNKPEKDILFKNHSNNGDFEVSKKYQSTGTMKYIGLLDSLYSMLVSDHICLFDELEEKLHYDLLLYILNVFLYNTTHSQLIFTTQELLLLSEDLLNEHRDIVWFVEKSHETASSEYTRADSYGLHKNLSLFNSYKIGRLGAKPQLGSPFISLD
jgi:hypothetical protein